MSWPLHTSCRCGKREARINWSMVTYKSSTCYWNYLEYYWPCVGGLSAVCMYVLSHITYSKSMDQPAKVANPDGGQLNRENEYL